MKFGLELLADQDTQKWGRCGLVANQASVSQDLRPSWQVCRESLADRLTALFGPQHGFESTVQDNMIETEHAKHAPTGLPVHSLYSETREPNESMLENVDTLIVDLQVTGCRIYTYKYTLAACMRAAKKNGKRVVVLDRPNPLGGIHVEGAVWQEDMRSFIGEFPLPLRHGLTMAEAATLFNRDIGCELLVVKMKDWDPAASWQQNGLHWVLTSPNLPTIDPVYVFPGMVMFEGTNVSEGRGTGLPFQFCGAPFVRDAAELVARINSLYGDTDAFVLRPAAFEPTSQKWAGEECRGFQIHVRDPLGFQSVRLGLSCLRAFQELCPEFAWRDPPYEYNYNVLPIRLLWGRPEIDKQLASENFSLSDAVWRTGLSDYVAKVGDALHYPRSIEINDRL